ncbi:hypothetical protein PSCICN_10160 [Pseudomonas cichorii]|uniref:hypothetical protein n=1 Tax=Pseudomonas cichorii TaxID=36746 RepID=UPI001910EEE1|nr:hypothetical protein [Pseudomonas cichorii]GFM80324.1 hypothetical protein PSCICN_10160 [Pseudomonas cichorii]
MEFIEKYKDLAEFIYYLSGPLILLGLIIALLQLKAFKNESSIRFKRETIATTLTILEQKLDQIEDSYNACFEDELAEEMPEAKHPKLGFSKNSSQFDQDWLDWYTHDDQVVFFNRVTDTLNAIETLSQYIFSGITDEELCYKLDHIRAMHYIEVTREYWAESRAEDDSHLYEGIYSLYILWGQKMQHDKSQKELVLAANNARSKPRPKPRLILGVHERR